MKLTQVPDLSLAPNIESVNLMLCASLIEIPSYFQHLNKLKKLELRGCASLCKLSGLPKNLITLEVLTRPVKRGSWDSCSCSDGFTWCLSSEFSSKLERFPEISHPMECIETLKLDSSAIKELPFSIKNLTGLKKLSLKFCQNLEFLPDSFHCLSSLQEFRLTWCRKLESLPRLPLSLSVIEASWCTSLKKVSSSIDLVNQNWDDFFNSGYYKWHEMNFLGCDTLDENARKVLMKEARFRLLRFATLYSNFKPRDDMLSEEIEYYFVGQQQDNAHFLWPESEIPWWFSHKSEESSITINLPHPDQWYDNSCLGLAACVVLEFKDIISFWKLNLCLRCDSVYTFPNGDSWRQTRYATSSVPLEDITPYFCDCCNTTFTGTITLDRHIQHHNPTSNCQHVFMFVDPTYGKYLALSDGQIDTNGNVNNRNMDSYLGNYVKADQGSSDFDENEKSGFDPTVTASFSFYLYDDSEESDDENEESDLNSIAKVMKCGVHLLYTHETKRFESNKEPEARGREAIYFESNQEGEEPLPKRIRA